MLRLATVTSNLRSERWSKLVANAMNNELSACTGLSGGQLLQSEQIRRFSTRLEDRDACSAACIEDIRTTRCKAQGEGHNITSRSCRLCHNHSKGGVQSSVSKPLNKSLIISLGHQFLRQWARDSASGPLFHGSILLQDRPAGRASDKLA